MSLYYYLITILRKLGGTRMLILTVVVAVVLAGIVFALVLHEVGYHKGYWKGKEEGYQDAKDTVTEWYEPKGK